MTIYNSNNFKKYRPIVLYTYIMLLNLSSRFYNLHRLKGNLSMLR